MATVALGAPYRRLVSATLLSNVGDGIRAAAFPLLAATLTRSPVLIAGVAVATQLPGVLLALPAGSLADRFDRRRIVIVSDAVRLAFLLGLIGLIASGSATMSVLYVVVFVSGATDVVRATAASTLVPSLVPLEHLDRANGRLVTAEIAGNEFIGPPLGGFLFGIALVLPFAVNGGTLAIAVALVVGIPAFLQSPGETAAGTDDTARPRAGAGVGGGLTWLRAHRSFWPVPATSAALAITDSAWFTLLVLYVQQVLHLNSAWYGILLAVGAVGGLSGGFFAAALTRRVGAKATTLICLALAAAGQLALGATSSVIATAAVLATSSMAFAIWTVQARTTIQSAVPADLLGRVISINRAVITAASLAGAALGGITASRLGLHAPFLLGIPILIVAGILIATSRTTFAAPTGLDGADVVK